MSDASGGVYLPPVVAKIIGDDGSLVRTFEEAKALLADLTKTDTTVQIDGDSKPLTASIAAANAQLLAFAKRITNARLGADAKPFWTELAALRASVESMSPLEIRVALSGMAATLTEAELTKTIAAGLGGAGGAGGGGLAGLLMAMGGGNGKGVGLGFAGALGLPAFGSLLSLGGLGAEHMVTTGLGLAGSAVGGLLGGAALGGTALGVMGVGMGTDMAGIGQALNDTKAVYSAQQQLNQAMTTYQSVVAQYGAGSAQAALALQQVQQAQVSVNSALTSFSPIARGAVAQASQTAIGFRSMFDQVTGQAEKIGAQILTQLMQVGETFLPAIGSFAAQNMSIIKSAIQPLLTWIQGPGFMVFHQLEDVFQRNLPTAIHAFTQAFELIGRVMERLAPQTGGIVGFFDKLFTRLNGSGFSHFMGEVQKMVDLFHTWMHFLGAIGHTIVDLFKPAVGVGQTLIKILTGLLGQLDKWLTSNKGGKGALSDLLGAHLGEIKALGPVLASVLPALEGFASAYMRMAGGVTRYAMVPILEGVAKAISLLNRHTGGAAGAILGMAGAFYLVGKQLNPVLKNLGALKTALTSGLASGVGVLQALGKGLRVASAEGIMTGLKSVVTSLKAMRGAGIAASEGEDAAAASGTLLDTVLGIGVLGAIAALALGIYELVKHWKTVWNTIEQVAGTVASFIIRDVVTHIVNAFLDMAEMVTGAAATAFGWVPGVGPKLQQAHQAVVNFKNNVDNTLSQMATQAGNWGNTTVANLVHNLNAGALEATQVGRNILAGLSKGLTEGQITVADAAQTVMNVVTTTAGRAVRAQSPSVTFMELGQFIVQGLSLGLGNAGENAKAASTITTLMSKLIGLVKKMIPQFQSIGVQLMQGLAGGIVAGTAAVAQAAANAVTAAMNAAKAAGGIHSPSLLMAEQVGLPLAQGVAMGVQGGTSQVMAAMSSLVRQGAIAGRTTPMGGAGMGYGGGYGAPSIQVTQHLQFSGAAGSNPQLAAREMEKAAQQVMTQVVRRLQAGAA